MVALPLLSNAGDNSTVGRATLVSDPAPRTAADRWKRLKALYPLSEGTTRATVEADPDARPAKVDEVFRPIPDESLEPVLPPVETSTSASLGAAADSLSDQELEAELPMPLPERPSNPIGPLDEEPAWVLPSPVLAEPVAERPEVEGRATAASAPEPSHVVPAPMDTESSPGRLNLGARATIRQVSQQQRIAPVHVRSMSEIMPVYDPDSDREIRQEALEKSKEFAKRFGADHFGADPYAERAFPEVVMPWEAPNFYYYPLYFEDPALERYGHTHHPLIQPLASIGRFSTQLVFLPYQMTIDPPCREVYALGYYRPGECAPKLRYRVPLNAKAAAVQAATVTGLVFLIP